MKHNKKAVELTLETIVVFIIVVIVLVVVISYFVKNYSGGAGVVIDVGNESLKNAINS